MRTELLGCLVNAGNPDVLSVRFIFTEALGDKVDETETVNYLFLNIIAWK